MLREGCSCVRDTPPAGLRFEVVSPDVLPAASFDPPAHCVTVTHRACGGLAAGEVGELAGGLLDAARGGKIGEGDGALCRFPRTPPDGAAGSCGWRVPLPGRCK